MGRTAGCPAKPGRVGCGRKGAAGPGVPGDCTAGAPERATGAAPGPLVKRTGSAGRKPPGSGCLGPERTCPGRGAEGMGLGICGAGRAGIPGAAVLCTGAAMGAGVAGAGDGTGAACTVGDELASGGRRRCGCGATRCGTTSSTGGSCTGSISRAASAACGCGVSDSAATLGSSSTVAVPFELLDSLRWPPPAPPKISRNFSATSSSIELECVFFSVTPNSGSLSSSS
jgi:hypothetical protein